MELAQRLVAIGAVSFSPDEPYTWASGLRAPMYCDNRRTLAFPDVRRLICRSFAEQFSSRNLHPDAIIGVATGAIAHGALLAEALAIPFGYVRGAAKEHGRRNRIEGFVEAGRRVVVVEDLISTGGSSVAAAQAVEEAGMTLDAVAAIFDYGFPIAKTAFSDAGFRSFSLLGLSDLIFAAQRAGTLDPSKRALLEEWMNDPVAWSNQRSA